MWAGLGDTLPMAMGLALSPVAITTALVFLPAPRGRVKTALFAAGWFLPIFAVTAISMVVTDVADEEDPTGTADGLDVLHLAFGILFFALAALAWIKRPDRDRGDRAADALDEHKPGLMDRLDGMGVWAALGVGVAEGVVILKNIPLAISAGTTLGAVDMSTEAGLAMAAVFTALATLGVLVPLGLVLIGGARVEGSLREARAWIDAHMTAITLVVLLVFGALFLGEGLNLTR